MNELLIDLRWDLSDPVQRKLDDWLGLQRRKRSEKFGRAIDHQHASYLQPNPYLTWDLPLACPSSSAIGRRCTKCLDGLHKRKENPKAEVLLVMEAYRHT